MTKSSWIDGLLAKRIVIGPGSWHFRLYEYWKDMTGGNRYGYKENLCHYTRVVVIWAPLNWIKYGNVLGFVRPWTIFYGVLLALPLYLYFAAVVATQVSTWQLLMPLLVYIVALGGVFLSSYWLWKDNDGDRYGSTDRVSAWVMRIFSPLVLALFVIIGLFFVFGDKYGWPQIKTTLNWIWETAIAPWLEPLVDWYFHRHYGSWVITPFSVSFAIALVWEILNYPEPVKRAATWIVAVVVIVGVLVVLWKLLKALWNAFSAWVDRRLSERPPKVEKRTAKPRLDQTTTFRLAATYAVALHRGICPFIELPEQE